MNNNQSSNNTIWILAAIAVLGSAAMLSVLRPAALNAIKHQSAQLTAEASRATGGDAEVDYHLATWLDPNNASAFIGLARTQIDSSHPNEALVSLDRAGESHEAVQLKLRTLIELGRYSQAADMANRVTASSHTAPGQTDSDLVLAALTYALSDRTADIIPLIPRLSSPEALQSVHRAQAGQIPLAAELYATGLLKSSSALLQNQPASYERDLLLGRINYHRHTAGSLNQAAEQLASAINLDPSSVEARQFLVNVYRDQNKPAEAAQQETFIAKLQSGRP